MTIEIHQPELESLIQQRMKSGAFRSMEEVLMHALTVASASDAHETTGAELVAAMQACPLPDIEIDAPRYPMPVRDVTFR